MYIEAICSDCNKEILITPAQYENFHDYYCEDCFKKWIKKSEVRDE